MAVGRLIFSSAILLVICSLPAGKDSSSRLARRQIPHFTDLSSGFVFAICHFGSLRLSLARGGSQWTRLHFFVGRKTNSKNLWCIRRKFLVRKILYTFNGTASFNPEVLLLKLSGDVHPQPGPAISQVKTKYKAPRCPQCEKPVQQNHK